MSTYQFKSFKSFHLQVVLAHWQEPWISQHDLAQKFGITDAWMSQILTSPEAAEIEAGLKDRSIDTMMDVQAQLQAIAPAALQERWRIATDLLTPVSVRDRALGDILEMAGHSPPRRVQIEKPNPEAALVKKTDAELRDELASMFDKNDRESESIERDPDKGPDGKPIN